MDALTLTGPAAGTSYTAPATIALSATASDKDGTITRVQFYRGSVSIGADTVAPYGFNWSVSTPGTYQIVAVATDNGGLRTTSAPSPSRSRPRRRQRPLATTNYPQP